MDTSNNDNSISNGFYSENIINENSDVSSNKVPVQKNERIENMDRMRCMITDLHLPTIHDINLADSKNRVVPKEKWIDIKGKIYPLKTINPKVQLSYQISPNAIPRKVEIERKRRQYADIKINELLLQANIEPWLLIPVDVLSKLKIFDNQIIDSFRVDIPKLPLEWFDNYDYDCMLPANWLNIGMLNGTKYPIPAKAFLPSSNLMQEDTTICDKNQLYAWKHVSVEDYNYDRKKWFIIDSESGKKYNVPRIYLEFLAEDPCNFMQRIKAALQTRQEAKIQLKFNIIIDCMILTGVPTPSKNTMLKIFNWVMNKKKLEETERFPSIIRLEDEINREYQRSLGKLELLHNVRTRPDDYTFLSIPQNEKGIHKMSLPCIPITIGKKLFSRYRQKYKFITLYCLPEVIMTMEKVVTICADVSQMLFYTKSFSKTASLDDFYSIQKYTTTNVITYLRGTWIEEVSQNLCMHLQSLSKGWFDINMDNWDIYKFSKLLRLMDSIKFRMQSSLRNLIEMSVNLYIKMLCNPCKCLLHVENNFIWDTDLINSPFKPASVSLANETHVFFLTLEMNETEAYYSTCPSKFQPIIVKLLDDAIYQSHFVHTIDKMTMIHLVFADNLYLSSVGLIDPIIEEARNLLILSYEKAIIPLCAYALRYNKYIEFFNLDVQTYLNNFMSMNKSAQEFQQEIQYHFRMKENLQVTLPDQIQIGPFLINVLPIKELMIAKRQQLAMNLIENLTEKLRLETEEINDVYDGVLKRLTEKMLTIEQLCETVKWMETIPETVQEHETMMRLKLYEYDILESFWYALPQPNFILKWQTLAGPLKCTQQINETKLIFEEETERFLKQQITDITIFNERVEAYNVSVSQYAMQYDTQKCVELSIEIKKLWKLIADTQDFGKLLNTRQLLFDMPEIDLNGIEHLLTSFLPYKTLWVTAADFLKSEEQWCGNPIGGIVVDNIRSTMNEYKSNLIECCEQFKELLQIQNVAKYFYEKIQNFQPTVNVIEAIKNPAWLQYHWLELNNVTNLEIKFSVNMNFNYLLSEGIMEFAELIFEMSAEATKNKDEIEAKLREEEELRLAKERELIERRNRRRGRKLW